MNKELLLQVADAIESSGRFDLRHVCYNPVSKLTMGNCVRLLNDCNTVGCVAGWTLALSQKKAGDGFFGMEKAAELLELEDLTLFFGCNNGPWPQYASEFGWDLDSIGGLSDWSQVTAQQAAIVLRRFCEQN